jgi:D-alanyl-D-alanine dipeptidase/carboxypeptidase
MKTVLLPQSGVFTGSLILVNALHPLRSEPTQSSLVPFPSESENILLLNQARPSLVRLMDAVGGWQTVSVCSGWRSSSEQQAIWDSALAEHGEAFTSRFVARPGHSEHQTGLAVDLGVHAPQKDALSPEFPDSGVCRALRQKAAAFGWIERYPKGK